MSIFRLQAPLRVSGIGAALALAGNISAPSGDPFPDITAPAGSLGFTTEEFTVQAGSSGRLAYLSTSTQLFPDADLYSYRYKFAGPSSTTLAISGIQAGPWYYRVADFEGTTVGDLSDEFGPVTAA
jgi:hypothetical protein